MLHCEVYFFNWDSMGKVETKGDTKEMSQKTFDLFCEIDFGIINFLMMI